MFPLQRVVFLILFTAHSFLAFAHVEEVGSIAVEKEMARWNTEFSTRSTERPAKLGLDLKKEGYTECAEVVEIKGAYICASQNQVQMNQALARASFFVEGLSGTPARTVVRNDDPKVRRYLNMIGGHDLKSEDLLSFWAATTQACAQNASLCPSDFEKDFFENFVLPKSKRSQNFVVITYASRSHMRYTDVVTHEIMHAQYFLQPELRAIADNFWQTEVSKMDQEQIKAALSEYYDSSNELLMINEFQAYILMAGAERNLLKEFVSKFRQPLTDALSAKGIRPVQVN